MSQAPWIALDFPGAFKGHVLGTIIRHHHFRFCVSSTDEDLAFQNAVYLPGTLRGSSLRCLLCRWKWALVRSITTFREGALLSVLQGFLLSELFQLIIVGTSALAPAP